MTFSAWKVQESSCVTYYITEIEIESAVAYIWEDEYVTMWRSSYLLFRISTLLPHAKKTHFDILVIHHKCCSLMLEYICAYVCACVFAYGTPVSSFFLVSKPRATGRVVAMESWHHLINENRWVWEVNMGCSCWRVLWEKMNTAPSK